MRHVRPLALALALLVGAACDNTDVGDATEVPISGEAAQQESGPVPPLDQSGRAVEPALGAAPDPPMGAQPPTTGGNANQGAIVGPNDTAASRPAPPPE